MQQILQKGFVVLDDVLVLVVYGCIILQFAKYRLELTRIEKNWKEQTRIGKTQHAATD